jgi:hypothetical protein
MYKGQSIQHKVTNEELFIVSGIPPPPTIIALTLSPQPITSHHFAIHVNISHKLAFFIPSLLCTTLHFSSYHFTTLLDAFHFTARYVLRVSSHLSVCLYTELYYKKRQTIYV